MKIIKELVEDIREEMEGAEHYGKLALKYKAEDPALADVYYKLSQVEKSHADMLHGQVVRIIKEYRATGSEPPPHMQAIYDWEHEKMIDEAARVEALNAMYKST